MNNADPTISERHIQILKDFYRRFGANDRAHAVLLAMRAGVLR